MRQLHAVPGAVSEDGAGLLKVLHCLEGQLGNRHRNRDAPAAGSDGDGALTGSTRGQHAVSAHGADVTADRPGKGLRVRLQGQVLVSSRSRQGGLGAGSHRQGGQDGAAAVADRHVIRSLNGVDGGGALLAAALGGDGDLAAAGGGDQHMAVQLTVGNGQIVALCHGDIVGVHRCGGDVHLAARQHVGVVGVHVEVGQAAGGLAAGYQEDLIGDRPLAALGGPVDGLGGQLVRLRDGQGGGAAAVQADGSLAAQLDEPLGHLGHGGADGVAGLPAVDGVEDQGTVGLLAHGSAGVGPCLEAGDHLAVFHQGVQGAHGVLHILPFVVGGLDL